MVYTTSPQQANKPYDIRLINTTTTGIKKSNSAFMLRIIHISLRMYPKYKGQYLFNLDNL